MVRTARPMETSFYQVAERGITRAMRSPSGPAFGAQVEPYSHLIPSRVRSYLFGEAAAPGILGNCSRHRLRRLLLALYIASPDVPEQARTGIGMVVFFSQFVIFLCRRLVRNAD